MGKATDLPKCHIKKRRPPTRHVSIAHEATRLTSDEEKAGLELLEEQHALSNVPPREQDQHRARCDGRSATTESISL